MMTQREIDLLQKVMELEKENEKLEGQLKTGRSANHELVSLNVGLSSEVIRLNERVDELEERCNTYLEFIEKLRKATILVGDIAEFGLKKKECVAAIDKLTAMVVEIQENMLWCDDIEDDDEEEDDE